MPGVVGLGERGNGETVAGVAEASASSLLTRLAVIMRPASVPRGLLGAAGIEADAIVAAAERST